MLNRQHPQNLCAANVEDEPERNRATQGGFCEAKLLSCGKEADMNNYNTLQSNGGISNPVNGVGNAVGNSNGKINILYSRLSRDDELQGPSNSIVNQQQQLQEYAERNGLVPYVHIEDDGYSGTRWDRPGWQELIAKVEADEVACICIKDGSRLGRDYLRVGLYRELFRDKGVRLIAINDNFDSDRGDDDFTPFREIMAEWYARDTSKKIKSVIQAKGRSGKPISCCPPYGFVKDPADKHKWLVDPEATAIVKRIFQMTMDGMGVHTICGILAREKVERPSYYLGSHGRGRHKNDYDRELPYAWGSATISHILRKLEYCGHTVNFRTSSTSFKSKKKHNPQEEWVIFEHTHEAIISQEVFDTVQKLRETPRRIDTLGEANPLTGLLWCSDCGQKLYNHRKAHADNPTHKKLTDVYCCSTYKLSNSKFATKCSPHHISTDAARSIILEVIKSTVGYVRNHEQEFVERIRESSVVKQGETAKAYQKQIAKNNKRLAEIERIYSTVGYVRNHEQEFVERIRESSVVKQGETAKAYQKQIAKNNKRLAEIERIYKSLYEDKALGKIEQVMFDQKHKVNNET